MKKRWGLLLILALSVAGILWVTLLSRLGTDTRNLYPPFWSYRAIANGSAKTLFEDFGNVVLFIPIGVIAVVLLHLKIWQAALLGLCFSLFIEGSQWFLWLGYFEVDDLIHNTLGAIVGSAFATKVSLRLPRQSRKRDTLFLIGLVIVLLIVPLGYQRLNRISMERYAALSNREDGAVNLLILNGEPGYVGDTDVYVAYNDDGRLTISGTSDKRAWKLIGNLNLGLGSYSFSGLSGAEKHTVAIELEYYDKERGVYIRLTPDVGPIEETAFDLEEDTRIRAYVGVYPGAEGDYLARPVIYREDY